MLSVPRRSGASQPVPPCHDRAPSSIVFAAPGRERGRSSTCWTTPRITRGRLRCGTRSSSTRAIFRRSASTHSSSGALGGAGVDDHLETHLRPRHRPRGGSRRPSHGAIRPGQRVTVVARVRRRGRRAAGRRRLSRVDARGAGRCTRCRKPSGRSSSTRTCTRRRSRTCGIASTMRASGKPESYVTVASPTRAWHEAVHARARAGRHGDARDARRGGVWVGQRAARRTPSRWPRSTSTRTTSQTRSSWSSSTRADTGTPGGGAQRTGHGSGTKLSPIRPFWDRHDGRWRWRGMFECVDLPEEWPVYVSWAEASAFARVARVPPADRGGVPPRRLRNAGRV